jgi:hypothetical protein
MPKSNNQSIFSGISMKSGVPSRQLESAGEPVIGSGYGFLTTKQDEDSSAQYIEKKEDLGSKTIDKIPFRKVLRISTAKINRSKNGETS